VSQRKASKVKKTTPHEKSLAKLRIRAREKDRRLRELWEVLGAAFDALHEGVLVIDDEMNILVLNRYMREIFKIPGEYEGKKCYEVIQGSPIPCRGVSCKRVMFKGEGEEEELVFLIGGEKRAFEVRTYPWGFERGTRGVIRTFRDITHRRALGELKVLKGVSRYMAHTVRNTVMPLGGYLKIIAKECIDEEDNPYFRRMEEALENLEEAVDEYTDFIKVKGENVYETMDLMEVVQLLPDLIWSEEARNINLPRYLGSLEISFHMVPSSFVVKGNKTLFTKGLLYMVKGAHQTCREFCPLKGDLSIETQVKGGILELVAKLRGVEVPEGVLVTMFQPWAHAQQEPAFHHWSVAIFHEVVEKHGGRLVVRREEGSTLFHASFSKEDLP
jgi:nitrogen fixation/metabolism regulation signal transduction histidine kinase